MIVTSSSMATYRACPRRWHYRYELGMRRLGETSRALAMGTALHHALEAWFKAEPGKRLPSAITTIDERALGHFDALALRALLMGYDTRWGNVPLEIVAVEQEFMFPFDGVTVAGKIDAIVRDENGDVWLVEHKSSSQRTGLGSAYLQRLAMDGQVSTYMEGARSLGYAPVGVLYDVVNKPSLEPYKATPEASRRYKKDGALDSRQRDRDEDPASYFTRVYDSITDNPNAYFARHKVFRLEAEVGDAAMDMSQYLHLMGVPGARPRNPDSCFTYGRQCPYWGVCTGTERLDDESTFEKLTKLHTELDLAELATEE